MAKKWISICHASSVGRRAFIILIADMFSSQVGVGCVCGNPSSFNSNQRYLAVLAADAKNWRFSKLLLNELVIHQT